MISLKVSAFFFAALSVATADSITIEGISPLGGPDSATVTDNGDGTFSGIFGIEPGADAFTLFLNEGDITDVTVTVFPSPACVPLSPCEDVTSRVLEMDSDSVMVPCSTVTYSCFGSFTFTGNFGPDLSITTLEEFAINGTFSGVLPGYPGYDTPEPRWTALGLLGFLALLRVCRLAA